MAGGEGEDGEHDESLLTIDGHRVAFNDRLATLEENQLQVQVALDATHHVVSDDVPVAQVEQRLTLSADHRCTHPAILGRSSIVEGAGVVRRRSHEMLMRGLVRPMVEPARLLCRPAPRALPM